MSAPPLFGQDGPRGATLFGVPGVDDADALTVPLGPSDVPPPPRFSAPPMDDLDLDGPPAIGLDDDPGDPFGEALPDDLDLPIPAPRSVPALGHNELDPASVGAGDDPPIELDLPAPVSGVGAGAGSADDLDLPAPAGLGGHRTPHPDLDLPAPARGRAALDPSIDLPSPVDVDLPAPLDLDLPTPVDLDLPQPADLDLPEPVGMELESAQDLPTPAGLDVEPAHLEVEPKTPGPAASAAPKASPGSAAVAVAERIAASGGDAHTALADLRRSPAPRALPRQPLSRGLLYGGAAMGLLVALGAGLFYAGVFDDIPEDEVVRGAPKSTNPASTQTVPEGEVAERSPDVLAKLATDTPAAYHQAFEASQAAGDRVGQAEAALLLHLRYGPDPVLLGQAQSLLAPFEARSEPFVQRVVGLEALVRGDLAKAEQALAGDDARARLYRGWLRLRQDNPEAALEEAEAVLLADVSEIGAKLLRHEAKAVLDPGAEVEAIERSIAAHPDHPGLRELLVRLSLRTGELAKASGALEQLELGEAVSKAYRARVATLRGRVLAAQGDYAGALAAYEEATTLAPEDVDAAMIARVRGYLATRDYSNASIEVSKLVSAKPTVPEVVLLQAEVAVETGDGDEALQILDKLAASLPDRAEVAYLRGRVHAMRLQLDEASQAFARALELDPNLIAAHTAEATMLAKAHKVAQAATKLDTARAAVADKPRAAADLLTAKARILLDDGQTQAARAALDEALAALPTHNEALLRRGLLRLDAGDTAGGREDLEALYARTGGYPGLAAPLGRLLVREGNTAALEELIGDTFDSPHTSPDVKLVGARLRILQGRPEDARVLAEAALAAEPSNWEAHLVMAQTLMHLGDHAAALQAIERARPLAPQAEVHLIKGQILEFNARHAEARPEYLKALKIDPQLHEARFFYGRLLVYQGASQAAVDELKQVVAATDAFPQAWLYLGRAQREIGKRNDALASLRKAVEVDPSLYEAYYYEGRLHYETNDHAKAIAALEKAVDASAEGQPWYADAWIFLGRAQAKAGKRQQAKASFEKFLAVSPANHPSRAAAERELRDLG